MQCMILQVIEEDDIEDTLSSEMGCSMHFHPCALMNDELFQLKSCAYIQNNACISSQLKSLFSEWVNHLQYLH